MLIKLGKGEIVGMKIMMPSAASDLLYLKISFFGGNFSVLSLTKGLPDRLAVLIIDAVDVPVGFCMD